MILYPHYGDGDLRKRSNDHQRQQVLQAVYDYAFEGMSDVKYRDQRRRHVAQNRTFPILFFLC